MPDTVIKVENLSKQYRIKQQGAGSKEQGTRSGGPRVKRWKIFRSDLKIWRFGKEQLILEEDCSYCERSRIHKSKKGYCDMKQIKDLSITSEQIQALKDLKRRLYDEFKIEELVLYGSVARNQPDDESDIDLLVLTTKPLTRFERHKITDVVFEINLQYGTNFSTLVLDRGAWQAGPISVLPLRDEIFKDGIML